MASRVSTAAWALTILGVVLPIAIVIACTLATHTPRTWLAIGGILGLVGPSSGQIIFRRRVFTRGLLIRIATAALAAILVIAAGNARELGAALATVAFAFVILVLGFAVGAGMDILDLERWSRTH